MSNIYKQWLQQKIAEMEEHRDLFPGDLDDDHASVLSSFRIALASLEAEAVAFVMADDLKDSSIISTPAYRDLGEAMERTIGDVVALYTAPPAPANAEPVAWLWSNRKHPSEVTLVRPEDDEKAEGAHWSGWSCQALYAEPPAPVSVPDEEQSKPHPVMAVKGELGFLDHFERIIDERDHDIEIGRLSSSNGEALMLAALDAFRAAMLQGADGTLTNEGTIPANTPCKEAPEHIWLQTAGVWPENGEFSELTWCSDNQHKDDTLYVRADVVSGNSPVIPDGLRLALSNAGIAAPESDEMLAATCEKYIQALVTWVKDRKPFRSAVIQDGWVACSERMPEVGVKVLCFPVNDEPIHATYNGQLWLQDISWSTSDEPIDNVISCNVFHWMPLPSPPAK